MSQRKDDSTYIGARIPADLAAAFERVAESEDRTVSAELRRVIRQHVAQQQTRPPQRNGVSYR